MRARGAIGLKANQLRFLASSILFVNLEQTPKEELLFLLTPGFPVIWLAQAHHEPHVASPSLILYFGRICWLEVGKSLDHIEIVKHPGLSNREGPVRILPTLVHPHQSRLAHSDDDDTRLLVVWRTLRWWGVRGICGVFRDPNVGYVGFKYCHGRSSALNSKDGSYSQSISVTAIAILLFLTGSAVPSSLQHLMLEEIEENPGGLVEAYQRHPGPSSRNRSQ